MDLNKEQHAAIFSQSKHNLILAGAGTGKTRVIIKRIEELIKQGVAPSRIVSTTFTNKAAKELKERLAEAIGDSAYSIICGTFHRISANLLKLHGHHIGIEPDFQILTEDDQSRLIKSIAKDLGEPTKHPRKISDQISTYKESGKKNPKDHFFSQLFDIYSNELTKRKFLDYSDLIAKVIFLFEKFPDLAAQIADHVLVDEYQDINESQYKWISLISKGKHLFCVGDEDQSIYAFRGANIRYIRKFQEDYPDAFIVQLEENYRSCKEILKGATNLIQKNPRKFEKKLRAFSQEAGVMKVTKSFNEYEEARLVAKLVAKAKEEHSGASIGILVRTNMQTHYIEHALMEAQIPYEMASGRKFYSQKVVQDLVAYLRIILFPHDYFAFSRILNTPKRGFGEAKLEGLVNAMKSFDFECEDALASLLPQLPRATAEKCKVFLMQIQDWRKQLKQGIKLDDLMQKIVTDIQYDKQDTFKDGQVEAFESLKNHLKNEKSLDEFLANLQFSSNENQEQVQMMTIHAAKGLEFDVVIAPGWEEMVFPSALSKTKEEVEEERRLAYVAITRARKVLEITYCCSRRVHGKYSNQMPSRFIFDL